MSGAQERTPMFSSPYMAVWAIPENDSSKTLRRIETSLNATMCAWPFPCLGGWVSYSRCLQTDVFNIEVADLGQVYKIDIGHDNSSML